FMSKVWLVTGSASGLGRNIAEAVLASRDRLVATARDPRRLEDLVKKYGDQMRTAPLDVTDEREAYAAVQAAVDAFGRLDVVVNNAGYADIAPFEQLSAERFKAVVDTNFYGVVNVCRVRSRSCESRRAAVSFRYHRSEAASPGPAIRRITPPNGRWEDLPSPSHRNWLPLASRCVRSSPVACGPTGVRARTRILRTCSRTMNRPSAQSSRLWSLTGVTRPAIQSRSLRSSFDWLPPIACLHISCWAATRQRTPATPRRPVQPTQSAGETSACRPTSTHATHCLMWDSE